MRTGAALERVWHETRYAMRRLLRSPAFTREEMREMWGWMWLE